MMNPMRYTAHQGIHRTFVFPYSYTFFSDLSVLHSSITLSYKDSFFLSSLLYFVIFKVGISSEVSYSLSLSLELAGIIGLSLFASMALSSLIGTLIPVFFFSIKIDPAVASGPLITTVNDLVAVFVYYGLSYLLFLSFII